MWAAVFASKGVWSARTQRLEPQSHRSFRLSFAIDVGRWSQACRGFRLNEVRNCLDGNPSVANLSLPGWFLGVSVSAGLVLDTGQRLLFLSGTTGPEQLAMFLRHLVSLRHSTTLYFGSFWSFRPLGAPDDDDPCQGKEPPHPELWHSSHTSKKQLNLKLALFPL